MMYPIKAMASVVVTLTAYMFNWLFALFVQSDGNLPRWLRWFQPSDNLAIGDALWKAEHPGYSNYMLALTYMNRNPAQGFDQLLQADVSESTPVKVSGNLYIRVGPKGIGGWCLLQKDTVTIPSVSLCSPRPDFINFTDKETAWNFDWDCRN